MGEGAEQETFLGKRPVQQKSGFAGFREFLWNSEARTFLGRTGMSWLEITIFYIIFYACLAAFWAVALAIFVYTLDDELPRWYGKGTIIGINPGVGYQPWISDDPESTLIYINKDEGAEQWRKYPDTLREYLKKYDDVNHTRECNGDDNNGQMDKHEACRFSPSKEFGSACSLANDYGYPDEPCVLLSLNRLIGWMPVAYPANSAPAPIKGRYKPGSVAFDCRGENEADVQHLGEVEYLPAGGMNQKYFPYRVMQNYHQPVVMVKLKNPAKNMVIQVECLAYAYNIVHDAIERMGLTHFELLIDDSSSN